MLFNSLTFFVFLTAVFSVYWMLRERRAQNAFLLIASYNSCTVDEWKVIDKQLCPYEFRFPQQSQELLDDLYAVQGKTKIVWIVSPVAPSMRTCFKAPEKLQAFLKDQSNHKDVFAFSCLDRTNDFPQVLFVDHRHLNIRGAEKFSLILKGHLDAHCK